MVVVVVGVVGVAVAVAVAVAVVVVVVVVILVVVSSSHLGWPTKKVFLDGSFPKCHPRWPTKGEETLFYWGRPSVNG